MYMYMYMTRGNFKFFIPNTISVQSLLPAGIGGVFFIYIKTLIMTENDI